MSEEQGILPHVYLDSRPIIILDYRLCEKRQVFRETVLVLQLRTS